MKNILAFIICAAMLAALASCGGGGEGEGTSAPPAASATSNDYIELPKIEFD